MAAGAPVARLFSAQDLQDTELHPLGRGLAAVFTRRSPGKNASNEDACAIIPFDESSGLLAVADGCGGLPQGAKASHIAIQAIKTAIRHAEKRKLSWREAIMDGFEKANQDVLDLAIGAGTTLAVAEIVGDKIRPFHVGDSQIMIVGPMGKIKFQSKSHSPVGYALQAGLMNAKEAMLHAGRHIVSNLIGDPGMSIEVGSVIDLSARDTVIIASDGLFDNLHAAEIAAACRKSQLLAVCDCLAEASSRRMRDPEKGEPSKPDDLTIIAYRRRVALVD